MNDGEILNEKKSKFPLFKGILYGDKILSAKLSKRIACSIKHLPLRLQFFYESDVFKALEAGISKDPTFVLEGEIFIQGLMQAEMIERKFKQFLLEYVQKKEAKMQAPTPEQVEKMMIEKMGELPASLKSAKELDPRFLVEQAMSSKFSMQDEKNPFDPKTSMLIALATSVALGSSECMKEQVKMLKKMGLSKEELAYLIKIVKHAKSSAVVSQAKEAIDTFLGS